MLVNGTNHVKKAFEDVLRTAFASDLAPKFFRADDSQFIGQVEVSRAFPEKPEKFPLVVVQADATEAKITFLGHGDVGEVRDDAGVVVGWDLNNPLVVPIRLIVAAKKTETRELLTDTLIFFLDIAFRNLFARLDVAYTGVRTAGEAQDVAEDGSIYYTNEVIVDNCTTQCKGYLDLTSLAIIERAVLDIYTVNVDVGVAP